MYNATNSHTTDDARVLLSKKTPSSSSWSLNCFQTVGVGRPFLLKLVRLHLSGGKVEAGWVAVMWVS